MRQAILPIGQEDHYHAAVGPDLTEIEVRVDPETVFTTHRIALPDKMSSALRIGTQMMWSCR